MINRSHTPMASAPPEPPSPMTAVITGTRSEDISNRLRAIAPLWLRSSEPTPGIGARRVDQRDQRDAEALGELHQPQRLAIALGLRHAVVAAHPFLGVAALLVADQHDRPAGESREAADDREIVRIHAVAVQFLELVEDRNRVIERVWALRVARELRDLPRRQVGENAVGERAALGPQSRDLLADVDLGVGRDEAQLVDLRLELGDGLLEFQETQCHRPEGCRTPGAGANQRSRAGRAIRQAPD